MAQEKEYGLILPGANKAKPLAPVSSKPRNVFGEDSSEDEESAVDWVKQSLKKQSHGSMQQKQSMKEMKKALEDDPSVYEYDEVYDEMEKKKAEVRERLKGDKKPKYIHNLLKVAKTRELESELRKERAAQKERENEGDMYKDKEAFVTTAYKKKMETIRELQKDQEYQDAVDASTEVTKQKDLSGFYRYLYREKMKEENDPGELNASITDSDKPSEDNSTEQSQDNDTISVLGADQPTSGDRSPDERSIKRESHYHHSPESLDRRERDQYDERRRGDSYRRRRSRSGSYDREKRRRYESSDLRRRDVDRDRRDNKGRERDESNRNRYDRHRRSRSRDKSRRENEPIRPIDRSRYYNREDRDNERSTKEEKSISEKDENSSAKNSRLKIIQKENWYDFDVEIERDVNKDFYSKRTIGQAFDDALQRYLMRKGPDQILDINSKH